MGLGKERTGKDRIWNDGTGEERMGQDWERWGGYEMMRQK